MGNSGELACNIAMRMPSMVNVVVGTANDYMKIQDLTQAICGHPKEADGLEPENWNRVEQAIPIGQLVDCSRVVERPKGCARAGSSEDEDDSVATPLEPAYAALKPSAQGKGGKQTPESQDGNPKAKATKSSRGNLLTGATDPGTQAPPATSNGSKRDRFQVWKTCMQQQKDSCMHISSRFFFA